MYNDIFHEVMKMPLYDFPVKIVKHSKQKNSPTCEFHWHEQLEFFYIESGGMKLICNGEKSWVYPGDIAFINWCELHKSLEFLNESSYYVVQIDLSILMSKGYDILEKKYISKFMDKNIYFRKFINNDRKLNELFKNIICEYENKLLGYELEVKAYFLNVLTHLLRNYCSKGHNCSSSFISENYVKNIIVYIANNYNTNIDLKLLASELGISIPYMCRTFKKHTGTTIINYINQIRCNKAISLITSGVSITKASYLVGFNDSNYFCRVFKKIYGFTPSNIH